jgi:hypothetical protein
MEPESSERDDRQPQSTSAPAGPVFPPYPSIEFQIPANDLLFERMPSIPNNEFAIYHDITDGSAVRAKEENRQKGFRRVSRDREILQIDGNHITVFTEPQ